VRKGPLSELPAEVSQAVRRQLDKEAPLVAALRVLAKDDLAIAATDLADRALSIVRMPILLEPKPIDLEMQRSLEVSHKEDGT
jgi:hypothetical protein